MSIATASGFDPVLIAAYDVTHSRLIDGVGPKLDLKYPFSFGPQVLPVLESRLQHVPALQPDVAGFRSNQDIAADRRRPANWRAWGFRTWHLDRYLANNPSISPNSSHDNGKG